MPTSAVLLPAILEAPHRRRLYLIHPERTPPSPYHKAWCAARVNKCLVSEYGNKDENRHVDKDTKQEKSSPRGRRHQRWTRRAHSHAGSGHCQSARESSTPRGCVAVDVRAVGGNPQGWGFVRGSSGSESVPGGFRGTQGGRAARLTLEIGSELGGLACPRVLTDHLLEANMGDLDQVSCGEAALVPRDLVDGACGDTASSVSPSQQCQSLGARALFPQDATHHTFAHTVSATWNALPCLPCPAPMGSAVLRQH